MKLRDLLNEGTTERFTKKNVPNKIIDDKKKWIEQNPQQARMKPQELDSYKLEVFSSQNQSKVANDLHKALTKSGFYGEISVI